MGSIKTPADSEMLKRSCYLGIEFDIHRYLMSNADGRWNGAEKTERHMNMTAYYVAVAMGCSQDRAGQDYHQLWKWVHDETQALTSYLDERIGFPLEGRPDYDKLVPAFFEIWHELAFDAIRRFEGDPSNHW